MRKGIIQLEHPMSIIEVTLSPWLHHLLQDLVAVYHALDLHSFLNKDEGGLACRGDASPNHDTGWFLASVDTEEVLRDALDIGRPNSCVLMVEDFLNCKELLIGKEDATMEVTCETLLELSTQMKSCHLS